MGKLCIDLYCTGLLKFDLYRIWFIPALILFDQVTTEIPIKTVSSIFVEGEQF